MKLLRKHSREKVITEYSGKLDDKKKQKKTRNSSNIPTITPQEYDCYNELMRLIFRQLLTLLIKMRQYGQQNRTTFHAHLSHRTFSPSHSS